MPLGLAFKDWFGLRTGSTQKNSSPINEYYREFGFSPSPAESEFNLANLKFDNTFRLGIAILIMGATLVLWRWTIIPSILPVWLVFSGYVLLQGLGIWFFSRSQLFPLANYVLCTIDLLALSLVAFWTGKLSSPIYLVVFIPMIIKSFHREWSLLAFYGCAVLVSYGTIYALSVPTWTIPAAVEAGSRFFFIALTIGIILTTINLLKKKESGELRRLSRLKCMVVGSHILNSACMKKDLPLIINKLLRIMNIELASIQSQSQVLLMNDGEHLLRPISQLESVDSDGLHLIPTQNCPVFQSGQLIQSADIDREPTCPHAGYSKFKAHVCLPIKGEMNDMFGVLFAGSPIRHCFTDEDIQFFQFIATSMGLTIQRLKRMEELNLAFEMDSCAMATFMGSTRTMEDTLNAIADGIRTILSADQVNLMLWNTEKGRLETKYVLGAYSAESRPLTFLLGEGLPGRTLEMGKPAWSYDTGLQTPTPGPVPFKGHLCIPLRTIRGEPLGVLTASLLDSQRTFSIEEIDLVSTFCTRAAVAIENSILHQKERGIQNSSPPVDSKFDQKAA